MIAWLHMILLIMLNRTTISATKFPPEGDPPAKIRAPNPLLQTVNWLQHHTWASNGNRSGENWKVDFMMGSKIGWFVEFRVGTCNVWQLHTWNWNLMEFMGLEDSARLGRQVMQDSNIFHQPKIRVTYFNHNLGRFQLAIPNCSRTNIASEGGCVSFMAKSKILGHTCKNTLENKSASYKWEAKFWYHPILPSWRFEEVYFCILLISSYFQI